jgi:hypothetical protein
MGNKQIGSKQRRLGSGLILFILSTILSIVITPIGLLFGLFKAFYDRHFIDGIRDVDNKLYDLACTIDLTGNISCSELLNATLITKSSKNLFGKKNEYISSVEGKNERDNTLSNTGNILAKTLNRIDKDHCKNSIQDYIQ